MNELNEEMIVLEELGYTKYLIAKFIYNYLETLGW